MTITKITQTNWDPKKKLLTTHISGDIDKNDVEQWEESLKKALDQMEDNITFKIFINMHGFKAINIDVHKRFRNVIPLTLAEYDWKVGYLRLFEEETKKITYKNTRGIRCVAAAHTHQDQSKMELYQTRFSSPKEHFFIDPIKAQQWIENLNVKE